MRSYKRVSPVRRRWRFGLLTAAVLLIATVGAALTTAGRLRSQAPSAQRVFVMEQNETDPAVSTLASDLQKRGFTVSRNPASLPSLDTSATTSVALTAGAFHASDPNTLRSLYAKGIVIAAVNVTLPDLAAVLEPNGPSRPSMPGLRLSTPEPSQWMPMSSRYTLYTLMAPGSKVSMVLMSPDAFVDLIQRHEPGHLVLPATPPAPFVPGPAQSTAPSTSTSPSAGH